LAHNSQRKRVRGKKKKGEKRGKVPPYIPFGGRRKKKKAQKNQLFQNGRSEGRGGRGNEIFPFLQQKGKGTGPHPSAFIRGEFIIITLSREGGKKNLSFPTERGKTSLFPKQAAGGRP